MDRRAIAAGLLAALACVSAADASEIETINRSGTCAWVTYSSKPIGDIGFTNRDAGWLRDNASRVDIERRLHVVHRVRAEVMSNPDCTGSRIFDTETTWEWNGTWELILRKGNGNYYFTRDRFTD